jgi:glycosyltransferase involved in cell wall biosynthesis
MFSDIAFPPGNNLEAIDVVHMGRFMAPCGVSTYTEQLAAALHRQEFKQLALASTYGWLKHAQSERRDPCPIPVCVCWDEQQNLDDALRILIQRAPKIVHIQHEFGIFRLHEALCDFLRTVRKRTDIRAVVTLHTVPSQSSAAIAEMFSARPHTVVVHSAVAKKVLVGVSQLYDVPVDVIPHGMLRPGLNTAKSDARNKLSLPDDAFVMLTLGFIAKSKKHIHIINALAEAIGNGWLDKRRTRYVIAGKPMGDDGWVLVGNLEKYIDSHKLEDVVKLYPRFIPFEEVELWYAAADLAIHANDEGQLSSSGSIRMDLSFGMPVIAQDVELTADLPRNVALFYKRPAELSRLLSLVPNNEKFRLKLSTEAKKFANQNSWDRIASVHAQLYERVLRAPLRKGWRRIWRALLQTRMPSRGVV